MKSVADFLVAGRKVSKFMGSTAGELAAGIGVISLLATMLAAYESGLAYWYLFAFGGGSIALAVAIRGWGICRLRESKVLTINELLERRYKSKKLRFFCGIMAFISGLINSGIFPIVTAFLVLIALMFCFVGGQISVLITDFIQGSIVMIIFIVVTVAVYRVVNWNYIATAYTNHPDAISFISPFGNIKVIVV